MSVFRFAPFVQYYTVQHILNANTPVHTIPDRVRHFAMNDACLTESLYTYTAHTIFGATSEQKNRFNSSDHT